MQEPSKPDNETLRLASLHNLQILDTPPEERFDRITRTAARLFNVPIALVSLVDADRQWFKSCFGLEASETPRDISFCGHAILHDELFVIEDALQDVRFADNPLVTGAPAIRFYAGRPLHGPGANLLGTLCIIDTRPRRFDEHERQALRDLGAWAESELNNITAERIAHLQQGMDSLTRLQEAILDSANFSIISTDTAGVIKTFNAGAQRMLGYPEAEVVGIHTPALIHDPDEVAIRAKLLSGELGEDLAPGFDVFVAKAARLDIPDENEWTYIRKDGSRFPVLLSVTALRDAHGAINGYLGIGYDLTERKRAEAIQFGQKQLLDILHSATSHYVTSTSPRETFDYLLTGVLGLTGSEYGFIGEVLYESTTPYLRTHAISNIAWNDETRRFYDDNAPQGMVFRNLKTLFGKVMTEGTVVISNSPADDPRRGGLPPGHPALNAFLGVPIHYGDRLVGMFGISNRAGGYDQSIVDFLQPFTSTCGVLINALRSDRARNTTLVALRDSEARIRAVLDNILEGIITINESGIIESFNDAAEDIFGYAAHEAIGRNVKMLMPSRYALHHDEYIRNYLTTGNRKIVGFGRELVGLRKDGSEFPIELTVSELHHGDVRIFIGIVRDITERKKLDSMKNEFISTVSHELRTPLTSIRGSLGLIIGGAAGAVPDRAKDLIRIACNNSERLVRLINDILDVEKIESGKMGFDFEPIDLTALLGQALEANSAFAEQYRVQFVQTESLPGVTVIADGDRLTQVITNLLSNAAKFSPPDSVVEVSVRQIKDRVRVSITDHGPGIPEEFRARIFQKFAQADASDSRQKGGTGLGLSISKAIIERLGGSIGFITDANGATFYFDLRINKTPGSIAFAEGGMPDNSSSPRILICEDDADVAHLLSIMLQQIGYASDIAHDAQQAKLRLRERPYFAMTLDIMLPGQDGISLIRELRLDPDLHHLPIVVVSAKSELGQTELSGDTLAVVDWLSKPIDPIRLQTAVNHAYRRSKTHRPTILYIEDDADIVRVVSTLLQDKVELLRAQNLAEARELLNNFGQEIDLVILDIGLPDGSGLDLLPELRHPDGTPLQVIVFSAYELDEEIAKRVAMSLVKSRASNQTLLDAINALLGPNYRAIG